MIAPDFPSPEFFRRAIASLNADPDAPAAARGWTGDFGLIIEGEAATLAVYLGPPSEGALPAPEFLDEAGLLARGPSYFARASEATWRELIAGGLDPIAAIVQKRLEVRGDLLPVVARLQYRGLALRWLEGLRSGGR